MIFPILKRTFILLVITLLLISGGFYTVNRPTERNNEVMVDVKQGMSLSAVSSYLERENLIRNRYFFILLNYTVPGRQVRSGTYSIGKNYSSLDILRTLRGGKTVSKKVTIPEGSNIYEVAVILDNHGITGAREFVSACLNRSIVKGLGINSVSMEGYLFPDTYYFPVKEKPEVIIKIMHRRFRSVFSSIKRNAAGEGDRRLSDIKLIKLASLIEEEARIGKERKYISSVFHNRLEKNMKLDCDPTVRYAVKKFTGKIYYRDLESDSPYNTYKHRGLPPTPITNPGRESIIAAIYPAKSDFLFFVARNDGSHYFSRRLSVHNRAVQKFQRGKNNGFIDRQNLE